MESANVAAHLPRMARLQPDTPAVILQRGLNDYGVHTFRELDELSDAYAAGLEAYGIRRGTRAALMVKPSLEFFGLVFALFKSGAVPVLIDPAIGARNLRHCLEEAAPEAFIGIPKAQAARVLLGWGKKSIEKVVTAGPRLFWGGRSLKALRREGARRLPYAMPAVEAGEAAAILFTSGSTGEPKGALYTHGIFLAQVEALRAAYGIQPGEMDLATFPLFALFGPALGMTALVPDMDATRPAKADPERLVAAIARWKATNLFGSPALIDKLSRYGEARGIALPSLKRALSAGAPVPPATIRRFQKLLAPGVQLFTPYGATEALPVCSIGSAEILGETAEATRQGRGVCVGPPLAGMQVRIVRITDEPVANWSEDLEISRGEIGEIAVKGPVVTRAYFNRDRATELAKIADPRDGGFWHRMGDLGYLDERGRVWMCGRKSHRVRTAEGELYTVPCEGIFNAHPSVFRTALVGVGPPGAQRPVLCVELEKHADPDLSRVRRELLELGAAHELTRGIREILFHSAFPVDIRHNAKIFRERLAVWAARRLRGGAGA
ncbi:MAG: fatty acid CoA ligase family protein [Planctomycetota bacterium]|nr:fatty acid CoA ligase family protein [Planctomycetota bacterium]